MNLDSSDGQRPPDGESERLHREPAPNYAPAAEAGHFVKDPDGTPYVARWWMGTGSPIDFTSPEAERWWRELARGVLELGVEGIKADDGEGYYFPDEVRFADGRNGAQLAWEYGGLYWDSMQRALDEATGGSGVLFGRSGWSGRQRLGVLWGGDQASDFWSLQGLGRRHAHGRGERLLELVARRRRLPRRASRGALSEGAPDPLAPVRLLHAADGSRTGASSRRRGPTTARRSTSTATT